MSGVMSTRLIPGAVSRSNWKYSNTVSPEEAEARGAARGRREACGARAERARARTRPRWWVARVADAHAIGVERRFSARGETLGVRIAFCVLLWRARRAGRKGPARRGHARRAFEGGRDDRTRGRARGVLGRTRGRARVSRRADG